MNIFDIFRPKVKVVTHSGSFHADDVFACATLSLWAEQNGKRLEIKRTRDGCEFAKADFVVDVGMEYDPARNRFDHHQKGGAGVRPNAIPYASFGLVWKHFGEKICNSEEVAILLDQNLIASVDAQDAGFNLCKSSIEGVPIHQTGDLLFGLNPTWIETEKDYNALFYRAMSIASLCLEREIVRARAEFEGAKMTKEAIEKQNEPEILILDKYTDWEKEVSRHKNIKFVVYLHRNGKDWCVQAGRDDLDDFNTDRAKMPLSWQGLRDGELERVNGIKDSVFCTNGGWYAVARSKDPALKMAQTALAQS